MTTITRKVRYSGSSTVLPGGEIRIDWQDHPVYGPPVYFQLDDPDSDYTASALITVDELVAIRDACTEVLNEAVPPEPTKTDPKKRAKMFALVTHIGLSPDERAEITELVLGEPHSWSDLTDAQATRLLDALEGWVHINQLIEMRA